MDSSPPRPKALSIAILAMGGEGGGVMADWLVDMAERAGSYVQTTSVPGVAQRTGATIYYVEIFPGSAVTRAKPPVLALMPMPGDVDVVIASELMEAGRAVQRGLVTPTRTTLIASTHRVYSMTERTAMADGRVDSAKLIEGARAAAMRLYAADFARIAEESGSVISAALFGALSASGRLPFARSDFEDAIRRSGLGVEASLRAFTRAHDAATIGETVAQPAAQPPTIEAGRARLVDYQDAAYAKRYEALVRRVAEAERANAPGHDELARAVAAAPGWLGRSAVSGAFGTCGATRRRLPASTAASVASRAGSTTPVGGGFVPAWTRTARCKVCTKTRSLCVIAATLKAIGRPSKSVRYTECPRLPPWPRRTG